MRVQAYLCALLAVLAVAGCGREAAFTDAEVAAAADFYRAVDASNAATRLTNRFTTTGEVPRPSDLATILLHVDVALEAARALPDATLERMHPEAREMFRTEFEAGLEQVRTALTTRDADLMAAGYTRIERWLDWLEANLPVMRLPPRAQEP